MELEPCRPCKARRLGKRQLQYLTGRLRDIDVDVYVTNIAKQMEDKEAFQLTTFKCTGKMWRPWKSSGELKLLAVFLLTGFCDLLETHTTGKERFARFRFAWYEFVGTVSVAARETAASQKEWVEISHGCPSISSEDRSAMMFAVASCAYTYLKQEVSMK